MRYLIVMFLTVLSIPALGGEAGMMVGGSGGAGCGRYLEYRNSDNINKKNDVTTQTREWGNGYLAGYSSAIYKPNVALDLSADNATISAWIDKWCSDNPLGTVMGAMAALRIKLAAQNR